MLSRIPLAGLQGVGRALRGGGSYLNQMTLVGIEAPLRHDRTIGHLGMTKMKAMVQSFCYWKNTDSNIENLVRKYGKNSYEKKNEPTEVYAHPWKHTIGSVQTSLTLNFLIIVHAFKNAFK